MRQAGGDGARRVITPSMRGALSAPGARLRGHPPRFWPRHPVTRCEGGGTTLRVVRVRLRVVHARHRAGWWCFVRVGCPEINRLDTSRLTRARCERGGASARCVTPDARERATIEWVMELQEQIAAFLDGSPHAVVGASTNREKYGNKVLRVYQQRQRPVYPVNPKAEEVEGLPAYPDLASLPEPVHGISVITPPKITESVVRQAAELGVEHIWMQPGAESEQAVALAKEAGINVIAGDACILVILHYHEG